MAISIVVLKVVYGIFMLILTFHYVIVNYIGERRGSPSHRLRCVVVDPFVRPILIH